MKRALALSLTAALLAASPAAAQALSYLRADKGRIVDESGRSVILRGMGLGGWMLQEGYMLQLGELGQEHVIRRRIADLIGPEREARVHRAWLDNHTTKADIDAMGAWGFNSVRLPLHYALLTPAVEDEPAPGVDSWKEDGFARIDALLAWTKANGLYLILDLHAAPGGQGSDLAISDRDPAKPSLWDSPANRRKVAALWGELARRYKDEPALGAYDLINEPNWDFDPPKGGGHGCDDTANAPLWEHYRQITAAIRKVDQRHMLILEGNCWGNNYKGLPAAWDGNMALSFHKYWNLNDEASVAPILKLRQDTGLPVWLGESGENSNAWFTDAIALVERHEIGWAFWPLKKIGFNQPLEVVPNPGYGAVVAYLTGKGPRPEPDAAYAALMTLASRDVRFENTTVHSDVIDAMLRQPRSDAVLPFRDHRLTSAGGVVAAVDYDLGPPGLAYSDRDLANLHVSTGGDRTLWNTGRTYRNDGVDIGRDADGAVQVADFSEGEWLRYTILADQAGQFAVEAVGAGAGGRLSVAVNGGSPADLPGVVSLQAGRNVLVLRAGGATTTALSGLRFTRRP
ncbi:glycosyl hydrolase family 5 [Caulobacter sp. B11]|uniref:cellulase family glycosylhydrolase n=1 Tax=Caulobacter sp. B11 TaxID=2048899 RepID=UPI000C12C18E|nr:cellulase family glycosylhydrolase [Caulobacter sp. B11]PHY13592.1 glycosyl hydrolase family 5 [Caulobacter sp. B11]